MKLFEIQCQITDVPHCLSVLELQKLKATHQREISPPQKARRKCFKTFPMSFTRVTSVWDLTCSCWGEEPCFCPSTEMWESEWMQTFCPLAQRCVVPLQSVFSGAHGPLWLNTTCAGDGKPLGHIKFFFARVTWLGSWHPIGWDRFKGWCQGLFYDRCLKEILSLGHNKHLFYISAQELITHVER